MNHFVFQGCALHASILMELVHDLCPFAHWLCCVRTSIKLCPVWNPIQQVPYCTYHIFSWNVCACWSKIG